MCQEVTICATISSGLLRQKHDGERHATNSQEMTVSGKKKERLAAFNRTSILETANELFLKNGVAGTTMDEIAKAAEYSKTTLYAYFKSKEDVFNHLILDGVELFKEQVRQAAEKKSTFEEFYFDFCHILTNLHDSHQVYFAGMTGKILCSEADTENDAILRKIYDSGEEINSIMEGRAQKGVADGEIVINGPVVELMMTFWFSIIGLIEKSSSKEQYILRNFEKTRDAFLQFSFKSLFILLTKRKEE